MWLIMCTHREFLISNAKVISKNIGINLVDNNDGTFECDGVDVQNLRAMLSYVYKKEAKK